MASPSSSSPSPSLPVCWWSKPPVLPGSSSPCPRHGHAAAYCNGAVWLVGGVDDKGQFLNDLYKLDLAPGGLRWEQVQAEGDVPSPRAGHILLPLGKHTGAIPLSLHGHSIPVDKVDKLLLAFGVGSAGASNELFVLDLAQNPPRWHLVHASGPTVAARHHPQHCFLALADGSRARLMVQGGEDGGSQLNDMFSLDLGTWTWERSDVHLINDAANDVMFRSSGAAIGRRGGTQLLVFGGEGQSSLRNDCLQIKTAEQFNPSCDASPAKFAPATILPAARCLFSCSTLRSDGRVLVEEELPNTLAPGAVQSHLGANPETREEDEEAKRVFGPGSTANGGNGVGGTAFIEQPGQRGSLQRRPTVTQLLDSVTLYSFLIGGCQSLKKELRFNDVWMMSSSKDGAVSFKQISADGPKPLARADFAAVVLPADESLGLEVEGAANMRGGSSDDGESSAGGSRGCIGRILIIGGSVAPSACTADVQMMEVFAGGAPGGPHSPRHGQAGNQQHGAPISEPEDGQKKSGGCFCQ